MKDSELKQIRDEDLYRVYVRTLKERDCASLMEAADAARLEAAERYYISANEAASHIGCIQSGKSLINLNSCSRRRIWQLWDNYRRWRDEHPESTLSRERVLEELVQEPAPEFYISASHARHMIIKERRKVREKMGL